MQSSNKQPIPIEEIGHDASIQCQHCAACCCRMPVLVLGGELARALGVRAGDAVILVPGPRDVPLNTLLHRNGRQISR